MKYFLILFALFLLSQCTPSVTAQKEQTSTETLEAAMRMADGDTLAKIVKSESEWKKQLPPARYHVLREKGTERAFSGLYWNHHEKGVYTCAGCNLPLFSSAHKFDSGTGWPSFWQPIKLKHLGEHSDKSYNMVRTEVTCGRCGGHLGHVFDDGPKPTGLRYCINSVSLNFVPSTR